MFISYFQLMATYYFNQNIHFHLYIYMVPKTMMTLHEQVKMNTVSCDNAFFFFFF